MFPCFPEHDVICVEELHALFVRCGDSAEREDRAERTGYDCEPS